MSLPNTSEKSVYLDREEHVHKGQLGAKRVVPYFYNSDTDTLEPTSGFSPTASITTEIDGNEITQTDGVRTYTVTISGNTITEVWT